MAAGIRDRDDVARDLIGLAGLAATALGLAFLAPSSAIGFRLGPAFGGIFGELQTTLPAAALVTVVGAVELAAGLVVARALRRSAFTSIADALLAGAVATVLKDMAELSVLGQLGLFRPPLLALVDLVILAGGWRLRPILATTWRPTLAALGSIPLAVLVAVVWAGPILVQLASPVVPFIDVLPNHVAPAEHLRTFGSFTPLTVTQSPIYGPSRTFLGYTAVLGAITALSGLPATLATAAFVLPTTLLIGVAAYRLTMIAMGGAASPSAGAWALLAFALTGSFARLSDDRATVIVLPLAAWALAFTIERLRDPVDVAGEPVEPWRLPDGVVLGLALAGAILVHPVIGALAATTVGVVALVRPRRAATLAVNAAATAVLVAAPQALTMLSVPLPAIGGIVLMALGVAAGLAADRSRRGHVPLLQVLRVVTVGGIVVGLVLAKPDISALVTAPGPFIAATALLLGAAIVGALAGAPAARDPVVLAAAGVGFAAAIATQLVPASSLLGQGIRFELPKTLYYWIPFVVGIAAAGAIDCLWEARRIPWPRGAIVTAVWIVVAAVPLRPAAIDQYHLGEHRFSEALAIDLRVAARGFWVGYPDSREIIDAPRAALVTAVRAEIAAGRIGPDTPILHVAGSFQQWVATPLGVFTGVTETDVSPDAEDSIHTVGGRLLHLESLAALLAGPTYPYLLLEPSPELPATLADDIRSAGYQPIFANGQGTLFRLGG